MAGAKPLRSDFPAGPALAAAAILLVLVDAVLVLTKVHQAYFVSVPVLQYVILVWGSATALIAAVTTLAPVFRAFQSLVTGRPLTHRRISVDQLIVASSRRVARLLRRPGAAGIAVLVLGGTGALIQWFPHGPAPIRVASSVLPVTIGDDTYIYVAEPAEGQVVRFRSRDLSHPQKIIPIGAQGNAEMRGSPQTMVELRDAHLHLIFVLDDRWKIVHILDVDNEDAELDPGLPQRFAPKSLAITTDDRKLFVSHEQPAPNGSISVFDISRTPKDFHYSSKIDHVNCPEGLAVFRAGAGLLVTTQCGGGKDPAMIIDTATNMVVDSIPNLAVGTTSLAVSRESQRLYVGRGNFPCQMPTSGDSGAPLSVVDIPRHRILNTICLPAPSVGPIIISRDSGERYLLVADGNKLLVFDRKLLDDPRNPLNRMLLNDIPLEGEISGLGAADNNSVYAFIPRTPRLFLYSPSGL